MCRSSATSAIGWAAQAWYAYDTASIGKAMRALSLFVAFFMGGLGRTEVALAGCATQGMQARRPQANSEARERGAAYGFYEKG